MHLFVKHAGKVLTHEQILREVWGTSDVEKTGSLRVFVTYLREKLEASPSNLSCSSRNLGSGIAWQSRILAERLRRLGFQLPPRALPLAGL